MFVVKFGGSVQKNFYDLQENTKYALEKILQGKVVFVVSAMEGISSILKNAFAKKDFNFDVLREKYEFDKISKEAKTELEKSFSKMKKALDENNVAEFVPAGEDHAGIILKYMLKEEMKKKGIEKEVKYFSGYEAGIFANRKFLHVQVEPYKIEYAAIDIKKTEKEQELEKILLSDDICIIGGYKARIAEEAIKMPENSTDETACAVARIAKKFFSPTIELIKDTGGIFVVNYLGMEKIIEKLSYEEAIELAERGIEVVYPRAIGIAADMIPKKWNTSRRSIPIFVKSRKSKGTIISEESATSYEKPFAAMTIENLYKISFKDSGMAMEPESIGYLADISNAFAKAGIDIKDTPSSSATITITIPNDKKKIKYVGDIGKDTEIEDYLDVSLVTREPYIMKGCERTRISIIGEGMKRPGILAYLSSILAKNNISIKYASQPEEDDCVPQVIFGINKEDTEKAIKALYDACFVNIKIK